MRKLSRSGPGSYQEIEKTQSQEKDVDIDDDEEFDEDWYSAIGGVVLVINSLFLFAWSIIGFVVYRDYPDCKTKPIGEMSLAWSVVNLIFALFSCCWCFLGKCDFSSVFVEVLFLSACSVSVAGESE